MHYPEESIQHSEHGEKFEIKKIHQGCQMAVFKTRML